MARVDLTIRGAGIFGLSIAWAATRRGARVRVVERDRIGAGSSGGLVGALAPHVPENWNDKKEFQLQSLLMAADWWADVAAAGGRDPGYARTGRLQPLADAHAVDIARDRALQARDLWRGQAEWAVIGAGDLAWAPPSPTGLLVHDTLSARLHPRMAGAALAAALTARGAEIVTGPDAGEGPEEGSTIWATGAPGLEDLSAALGRKVGSGVKGQALLLQGDGLDLPGLNLRGAPQLFADAIHIIPHADGTVAIGSTSENSYDAPDTTDAQLDALHARAVAACPVLAGARVIDRWAGLRPRARTRAPMLGGWPGRPGHFIANGGFKIGFGMAPKVAESLCDLILEGRDSIPPGFRVEANL